jgi:hypothetical protein
MTPEGLTKVKLKKYLRDRGAYFFMPVQTGYGAPTLDFLVCLRGSFIGYETKARGKDLTPRQKMAARAIAAAGGAVFRVTLDEQGELKFDAVINKEAV